MKTNLRFDNSDGRLRGRAGVARRLRIWAKDPHCAMCGRLTEYPDGFHLDHKKPLYKGGEDTDENLQVLCPSPCHEAKTREDMGDERARFDEDETSSLTCRNRTSPGLIFILWMSPR